MSFTALRGIERCPLQWAMVHAEYPAVWSGKGYPQRPYLATLMGQVVHGALETISRRMVQSATGSPEMPAEVTALKQLGGISAVLHGEQQKVLRGLEQNPRVPDTSSLAEELRRKLPVMRQHTQFMLSGTSAAQTRAPKQSGERLQALQTATGKVREPLEEGVHAEQPLNHPDRSWFGKADLIRLSGAECEIVDFKTGERKEEHALQLRLYALLWYKDSTVNPSRRLATRLSLVYPDGEEAVASPSAGELEQLEAELKGRKIKALSDVAVTPPPARPAPDACGFCQVRQLCPAYWEPSVQDMLGQSSPGEAFRDVGLRLHGRAGPWSWRARVESAVGLLPGSEVVVRTRPNDLLATSLLDGAARVRVLGAQILKGEDEESAPSVVSLTRGSEVFLVA